jgi:hypothetical protein
MFRQDMLVATVSKRIFNVPGAYGLEVTAWDFVVQALCTAMAV